MAFGLFLSIIVVSLSFSAAIKVNVELNARWTSNTLSPLQEARCVPCASLGATKFKLYNVLASELLFFNIITRINKMILTPQPVLLSGCSEFMAQDSNTMFWTFFDGVHASLAFHQVAGDSRDVENDACEWATEIVEELVSPDVFKVRLFRCHVAVWAACVTHL